jgi:TctA family transporter
MSAGEYSIFFTRPIATGMLLIALTLLLLGMRSLFTGAAGSRGLAGLEPSAGPGERQR